MRPMLSGAMLLTLLAFGLTLISGISGKVPLWVPLLLVTIVMMMGFALR